MEKYRAKKRDLHMMFIDLEKAYDSVPRRLIWDGLESIGVPGKYIDLIRDMYVKTKITIGGHVVPQEVSNKLKGKFYRVAVRPDVLYGTNCWAIKKTHARRMEVAEMRMLRWTCGHTQFDRIRNVIFRERIEVASLSNKISEGRLRWFGHVKRRQTTELVRVVKTLTVKGRRSRGRPKLTWDEQIRQDLIGLLLSEDMVHDRSSWSRSIKIKDF
ncbi:uncharacterized protein LOC110924629 [Helianthus annuus]|uniref:uncharacterized protein LOC110924629 n=1 Tax=Helianthus annuus TaxID=4232 RepID=UPI000B9067B6|nr:uncharacterized protein LOC110924629 [Helianthus annuus]